MNNIGKQHKQDSKRLAQSRDALKRKQTIEQMPSFEVRSRYSAATMRRIRVMLITVVIVFVFSLIFVTQAVMSVIEAKVNVQDERIILQQEEQRRAALAADLQRLDDQEYIRQYARDKYHYTDEGEILFLLPKEEIGVVSTRNNEL